MRPILEKIWWNQNSSKCN